jgi:ubiquinone/menaquinone biosynthesis C-methylase UbiE
VQGDVTKTNFQTSTFDAIVSSFMIDHLGEKKLTALKEINRIMKPKGRMLMIVLTPSLSSFAILNVLSFGLTSVNKWKKLFVGSGFKLLEHGEINGGTFFLIEK